MRSEAGPFPNTTEFPLWRSSPVVMEQGQAYLRFEIHQQTICGLKPLAPYTHYDRRVDITTPINPCMHTDSVLECEACTQRFRGTETCKHVESCSSENKDGNLVTPRFTILSTVPMPHLPALPQPEPEDWEEF